MKKITKSLFLIVCLASSLSYANQAVKIDLKATGYAAHGIENVEHYVGFLSNAATDGFNKVFKDQNCEGGRLDRFSNENVGTYRDGPLGLFNINYHSYGLQIRFNCSALSIKSLTIASRSKLTTEQKLPVKVTRSDLNSLGARSEVEGVYFYMYYTDENGEHYLSVYNTGKNESSFDENPEVSLHWIKKFGVKILAD